jgi:peptidoglycan-associated lipoprotein
MSIRHISLVVLSAGLVLSAGCNKRKAAKNQGPGDNPDEVRTATISSPEVEVQVIAIDPPEAAAGEIFNATVYGSGFMQGSRVVLGSVEAAEVLVGDENSITLTVPPMVAGSVDVTVIRPDGERATLRGGLSLYDDFYDPSRGENALADALAECLGSTLYFDLDAYRLDGSNQDSLGNLAPCLAKLGESLVVAGHTDERGSTDYNMALGQRRAEAVARYLTSYGVSEDLIKTISYGEESPADRGGSESSWAANRRVELSVRY